MQPAANSHSPLCVCVMCAGEAAGVVLMGDRLSQVVDSLELGRAALSKIRQNLAWALAYNLIGIPLAAGERQQTSAQAAGGKSVKGSRPQSFTASVQMVQGGGREDPRVIA